MEKQRSYRESHKGKDVGKDYDKYLGNRFESFIYELEQTVIQGIMQKHFPKKAKNSLDFACGTGRLTRIFEQHAKKSHGLDISKDMIAEAKKKCKKTTFIVGDITKKDVLSKKKFDLVTSFRFFLNAEHSLRMKVLQSLRPHIDDKFIFNIHMHRCSLLGMQFYLRKKLFGQKDLPKTLTIRYMKKILRKNGLRVIEIYPLAHLPGRLNFLLLPKKTLKKVELFLTKTKILSLFAKDLIFVVEKK